MIGNQTSFVRSKNLRPVCYSNCSLFVICNHLSRWERLIVAIYIGFTKNEHCHSFPGSGRQNKTFLLNTQNPQNLEITSKQNKNLDKFAIFNIFSGPLEDNLENIKSVHRCCFHQILNFRFQISNWKISNMSTVAVSTADVTPL